MGKASKAYLDRMAAFYADALYRTFVDAAEAGRPPPPRPDLADKFGTSRIVIQATHHRLEAEGRIVTERRNRWQRVQIVATGKWTAESGKSRPPDCATTPRRCLRCGQMFNSQGPGNRICCKGDPRYGAEGVEALGRSTIYW